MIRTLRTLRAPPSALPLVDVAALREFVKGKPVATPDAEISPDLSLSPEDVSTEAEPGTLPQHAEPAPDMPSALPAPVRQPRMLRVHFNTRLPQDVEQALRRVSLERKLNDEGCHSIQDIAEEALREWLLARGHLPPVERA